MQQSGTLSVPYRARRLPQLPPIYGGPDSATAAGFLRLYATDRIASSISARHSMQ